MAHPTSAPAVAAGPQGKKSVGPGTYIPYCQIGDDAHTSPGPCRKKPPPKRKAFRVPLKKEDGNLEAQMIEYNAEFPNRVVVRLEYLMNSTKVRLNDREWMAEFYRKLVEEENRGMKKAIREREKSEMGRMKQLIIDGINKEIPDELAYLHRHPVFRVNQMLQRLATFDHGLIASALVGDDEEITPVEPYEFDGNIFFKHLHDTGTIWVPDEQQAFEQEKLRGKVYRAKLRLKQKREQKATEEKVLRLLNSPEHPDTIALMREVDAVSSHTIRGGDDAMDNSVGGLVDRVRTKSNMTVNRLEEKIRMSKEHEMARAEMLERKRRENERKFLTNSDAFSSPSVVQQQPSDAKLKRRSEIVDDILRKEREVKVGPDDRIMTIRMRMHDHEHLQELSRRSSRVSLAESAKFEGSGSVFNKVAKLYQVPADHPFEDYEEYDNDLISEYVDNAEDYEELMECADEVTVMYDRQGLMVADHLKHKLRERKA